MRDVGSWRWVGRLTIKDKGVESEKEPWIGSQDTKVENLEIYLGQNVNHL